MRLDQVKVGQVVVYRGPGRTEQGVVTSKNDLYVFVRYGDAMSAAATRPQDLEPLTPEITPSADAG